MVKSISAETWDSRTLREVSSYVEYLLNCYNYFSHFIGESGYIKYHCSPPSSIIWHQVSVTYSEWKSQSPLWSSLLLLSLVMELLRTVLSGFLTFFSSLMPILYTRTQDVDIFSDIAQCLQSSNSLILYCRHCDSLFNHCLNLMFTLASVKTPCQQIQAYRAILNMC